MQHKLQALLANHGAGSVSIGRQEAAEVLGWLNTGQREEVGRQLLSWIQSQCAAMDAGESVRQRLLMEFEESIKDIWAPPGGQTLRGSEAVYCPFRRKSGTLGREPVRGEMNFTSNIPTLHIRNMWAVLSEQQNREGCTCRTNDNSLRLQFT